MDTLQEILITAQTVAHNAHTDQIVQLVQRISIHENVDDLIKMLIDERRTVWNEFDKRIQAEASK